MNEYGCGHTYQPNASGCPICNQLNYQTNYSHSESKPPNYQGGGMAEIAAGISLSTLHMKIDELLLRTERIEKLIGSSQQTNPEEK